MCLNYFVVVQYVVGGLLIIASAILAYYEWAFTYWRKRGIPDVAKPTFPYGTWRNIFPNKTSIGERIKLMYNQIKSQGVKHAGGFFCVAPRYVPIDLNYIKNIFQKDFHHFTERAFYYNEKDDPLSAHIFALRGEKWKRMRLQLSPAFTSSKLKSMFGNFVQCSNEMRSALDKLYKTSQMVDVKDVAECFTINVIGSCAFGVECNCFKNPDSEFRKQGKKAFSFSLVRLAKMILCFAYPQLALWLRVCIFDKSSTNFFLNMVKDTIQFREANNVVRKDLLQLLLQLNDQPHEDDSKSKRLTIEELTAQVFGFFVAGFETSSITLIYCLYELAENPSIQEKLRDELNNILLQSDGEVTYEGIMNMKYMDQVVEETLRKYPPVPFMTRICVEDYTIPGTEIVIDKGVEVALPIIGVHHDPDYYPDPDKFDPDRFSHDNKSRRHPFAFIPFGEGPRICMGLRFALMQIKVGLVAILKDYKYSLNKKTEVPLQMDPYSPTLFPKSDIFLDMKKAV